MAPLERSVRSLRLLPLRFKSLLATRFDPNEPPMTSRPGTFRRSPTFRPLGKMFVSTLLAAAAGAHAQAADDRNLLPVDSGQSGPT